MWYVFQIKTLFAIQRSKIFLSWREEGNTAFVKQYTLLTGSRCESDPIPDVAMTVSSSLPVSQTCISPK